MSYPPPGAKKKYKAPILKYVPCILNYVGHIFLPLKTRQKTSSKYLPKNGQILTN